MGLGFLGLLKANWKLILVILLLGGIYFYHQNAISNAVDKGISEEKARWEKKVQVENEQNRKYEQIVQYAVDTYGKKLLDDAEKRIGKETVYRNNLETIIKDNPIYKQCLIDQEVVDNLNEIRKLGPKS